MSIQDTNIIDGIGISEDEEGLALFLSDHLDWKDEYEHLTILQDKINAYIAFLENKQYQEIYPDIEFRYAVIEIHFKDDITDNCKKFLQVVQDQVGELGIKIIVQIS